MLSLELFSLLEMLFTKDKHRRLSTNTSSTGDSLKLMATTRRQRRTIIVILLWIVLVRSFDPAILYSIQYWSHKEKTLYDNVQSALTLLIYLSLPILALIADIKCGRLNVAIISATIGAVCSLVYALLSLSVIPHRISPYFIYMLNPVLLYTRCYFEVFLLCLGTEQLIDMSSNSDQLSSYIWWHNWCTILGIMITTVSTCIFESKKLTFDTYAIGAHLGCLLVIVITAFILKRRIMHYRYTENPLKLIAGVLNFALKHKFPLKRSALTYWEETEPSRINLGKTKYGGPFLEKDVESVKTFFRLLPLVFTITLINFPYQTLGRFSQEDMSLKQCLLSGTYFIEYCVTLLSVPIYLWIIKPYCFNQLSMSMLKRIGIGISLTVLAKLGYVAIDLYVTIPAYIHQNETVCLLQIVSSNTSSLFIDTSYYLLIPDCINAFGILFIMPGSLEFVFAQSPQNMTVLLIGLWYSLGALYRMAGWMMIKPFKALSQYLVPSCEMYVLIMNFIIMLLSLILFLVFSRCYKLHSQGDVFSAHQIAEVYYENEFNKREVYGTNSLSISSSSSDSFHKSRSNYGSI